MGLSRRELLIGGAAVVGAAALGINAGIEDSPEVKKPEVPIVAAYFLQLMNKRVDMRKNADFWNSFKVFITQANPEDFSKHFVFNYVYEALQTYELYWPQNVNSDKEINSTVSVYVHHHEEGAKTLSIHTRLGLDGAIDPDRSDMMESGGGRAWWSKAQMGKEDMISSYETFFQKPPTSNPSSEWQEVRSPNFGKGFQYEKNTKGALGIEYRETMNRDGFAFFDVNFPRVKTPVPQPKLVLDKRLKSG
ncbi:MAG: hypothetical protein KBC00_00245 [Candidatus Levybacteria bacterium]|nr:hypothetical protein [Candidatus Levybacteria bacterium]MBP9815196.1 hypothetical protein [Candidatus Levybacteria bacterium]HMS22175.1 hypothetical protein [Candidatus Levybacteria bacterium]